MASDSQRLAPEACSQLGILRIGTSCDGRTEVITLVGELDLANVADFERELRCRERAEPAVIAIDLSALTFIGSPGIAAILEASQRSSQRGYRLIVVSGNRSVQQAFEVCGLTHELPFVTALPLAAAARSTATTGRRGKPQQLRDTARATTRRRIDEAALAAAVRELRTHRPRRISW